MKKTAVVICSRCGGNKKLYGVRTEEKRGIWYFTWAFKLKEDVAKREGFLTTKIDGTDTETDNTYPGCPYCGKKGFVHCRECGELTCFDGENWFTCAHCGNSGLVSNGWDGVTLSGGDH